EYQYLLPPLGLTRVADPRSFFLHSTWFADDFLVTGVLDEDRFDALAAAVARLCACHAVDPARLRLPVPGPHDSGSAGRYHAAACAWRPSTSAPTRCTWSSPTSPPTGGSR